MLINLQEIKDFVSISAVADYLGLEEEYGKRKFPGERTASIELYPNTQTFYDFGRAVGGDIFDLLSHIKGMLESEQRFEIIGTLRRMPQNFLFKGLPDDIKDDYKLMDF